MQVHQTSQLVLGLLAGGGLFILLVCIHECLKSKALTPWTRPLVWAAFAVTMGAGHLSAAFDEPHQDSFRTNLIGCLSLLVPLCGLVWIIILHRADKRAKAEVGTTTSGEHTT